MALFLKQNVERTQLQSKIAGDLQARLKTQGLAGDGDQVIAEDEQPQTGRSVFWAGVAAMVVVALVVFVLFAVH